MNTLMNPDIIYKQALVPGERFVRVGVPHVVYVKTSNTWACLTWKGKRTDVPMHWHTLVRRAPAEQFNPGEIA